MKIDEEKTNECKKLTIFDSEYWEMSFNPFCLCNPRLSQTVIEALNNPIDHFGD